MICKACGSRWEVGTGIQVRTCPFCGASLAEEPRTFDTPEETLCEIVRTFGWETLQDGPKVIGIFADLAPQLTGARRLLGYLAECDGPRKLTALRNSTPEERDRCVQLLETQMERELFVTAESARSICDAFLCAVFWKGEEEPSAQTVREKRGVNLRKDGDGSENGGKSGPAAEDQSKSASESQAESPLEQQTGPGAESQSGPVSEQQPNSPMEPGAGPGAERQPDSALEAQSEAAAEQQSYTVEEPQRGSTLERQPGPEAASQSGVAVEQQPYTAAEPKMGSTAEPQSEPATELRTDFDAGLSAEDCVRIGCMLLEGDANLQDPERAYWLFHRAAEQGNPEGQFRLGQCYAQGKGVPADMEQAVLWFFRAVDRGSVPAMRALGVCYLNGLGVPRDAGKASSYFQGAAERGDAGAQHHLGYCYETGTGAPMDSTIAFSCYMASAQQGDSSGQLDLGRCYEWGIGTEQNLTEMVSWYETSADQGNPDAQIALARLYETGKGLDQNFEEALKWYQRSAESGNEDGLFHLGRCYSEGIGCPIQPDLGADCFLEAVRRGSIDALDPLIRHYAYYRSLTESDLQRIRDEILPRTINYPEPEVRLSLAMRLLSNPNYQSAAVQWIYTYAGEGDLDAMDWLADAFRLGLYVPKNPQEAKMWRIRADQMRTALNPNRGLFQRLFRSKQ